MGASSSHPLAGRRSGERTREVVVKGGFLPAKRVSRQCKAPAPPCASCPLRAVQPLPSTSRVPMPERNGASRLRYPTVFTWLPIALHSTAHGHPHRHRLPRRDTSSRRKGFGGGCKKSRKVWNRTWILRTERVRQPSPSSSLMISNSYSSPMSNTADACGDGVGAGRARVSPR